MNSPVIHPKCGKPAVYDGLYGVWRCPHCKQTVNEKDAEDQIRQHNLKALEALNPDYYRKPHV